MRCLAAVLSLVLSCMPALAGSPTINNLLPAVGQRGQSIDVSFYGDRLIDADTVLFHTKGITFEQMSNEAKRVRAVFNIAADAPLGEHQVRLSTRTGVTEVISFRVIDTPIVKERPEEERKQSTSFEDPQVIELGQAVYGRTLREDVDFYAVDLKKGQRLSVQVDGMCLGRGFTDSHLMVLDDQKNEIAECDDTGLLRQDPYLSLIAPKDGRYVIVVRDSGYEGNDNNWYVMHVGSFVRPAVTFPLGGKPGERMDVQFMGDAKGTFSQQIELPKTVDNAYSVVPGKAGEQPPTGHPFRVNHLTNVFESVHPDNSSMNTMKDAPAFPAPVAFNGIIEGERDHDYFKLDLKKGQSLYIRCYAGSMGSPLDSVINIYNAADNKHIQGNDDVTGDSDSELTFTAPADGAYYVRVRDHLMRGGPDFVYRVEAVLRRPHLATSIDRYDRNRPQDRQAIAVPQGNRIAALVRVQRTNVGGDIKPWFENLPEGLQTNGYAPKGRSEMPVVFEANGNASLGAGLVNIGAQGGPVGDSSEPVIGSFSQATPLVIANPNRTEYYHTTLQTMPVAVTDPVPFRIEVTQPKAPLVRDGKKQLQVSIKRDEGFQRDIRLYMLWRPPGMGATGSVYIKKDQNEATYEIDANGNMETRRWPLAIVARCDMPDGPRWVSSQLFEVGVEEQYVGGTIEKASCTQGETVDIVVKLNHSREWQGEGELVLHGLPAGCEVQPIKVKHGQETATFKVKTADKTPARRHKTLMCEMTIQINGEPVIHRFARGGQLRIDKPRNQQARAGAED